MVSRGDVMTLMTGNGMNENEKVGRREVAGLVTGCRLAGTRCTALASLTLMVNTHHRASMQYLHIHVSTLCSVDTHRVIANMSNIATSHCPNHYFSGLLQDITIHSVV